MICIKCRKDRCGCACADCEKRELYILALEKANKEMQAILDETHDNIDKLFSDVSSVLGVEPKEPSHES